jgi:hypothetical protein
MLFRRRRAILIAIVVLAFCLSRVALVRAQENRPPAQQELDVAVSMTGAYDSDDTPQFAPAGLGEFQPEGYSTWATGSLSYTHRFSRAELQTAAASTMRYYTTVENLRTVSHKGAIGLQAKLPARWNLRVDEWAAYSPSYLYALFPALPTGVAPGSAEDLTLPNDNNYDVDHSSSYVTTTTWNMDRPMGRRSSISLYGDFTHSNFTDLSVFGTNLSQFGDNTLTTYTLGGRVNRNITRNSSIMVGYRYRTGNFGYAVGTTTGENGVDIGYDLNRPVSRTRRINFFARLGASRVNIPRSLAEFDVGESQFQMNGEIGANYPLGQGALRGSFTRGLQFVAGLTQPVFVNGFSADYTGIVARRLSVLARISKSTGQSILTVENSNLVDTYTGEARLDVPLTRRLTAFTEYVYYVYDTREEPGGEPDGIPDIPLAPGIPRDLRRQGVRVGITFEVPVLRR